MADLKVTNPIVKKEIFYGSRKTAKGENERLGTKVTFKDGSTKTYLNPSGRGRKYSDDLKNAEALGLNCCQRSYRGGYLKARSDSASAYKAKKNKGNFSNNS